MSNFLVALSIWLHTIATIVMIGYFVFARLIYLPIFERRMQTNELCEMQEQVSARLRPFFGGSLLMFIATGTYLMLINQSYLGLGQFFGNLWSALMVIKHALVLVFLAVAIFSERVFQNQISDQNPKALQRFRWSLTMNMVLGLIILLLTSIAQAA